jgi:hypothetical protein
MPTKFTTLQLIVAGSLKSIGEVELFQAVTAANSASLATLKNNLSVAHRTGLIERTEYMTYRATQHGRNQYKDAIKWLRKSGR